jgi:hypothetical protein
MQCASQSSTGQAGSLHLLPLCRRRCQPRPSSPGSPTRPPAAAGSSPPYHEAAASPQRAVQRLESLVQGKLGAAPCQQCCTQLQLLRQLSRTTPSHPQPGSTCSIHPPARPPTCAISSATSSRTSASSITQRSSALCRSAISCCTCACNHEPWGRPSISHQCPGSDRHAQ